MSRLLLRKTSSAAVSPEHAERLVCATGCARVLHRDGNNLLVDLGDPGDADGDAVALAALRAQLDGWIVSEQGTRIPVPDTRVKLKT